MKKSRVTAERIRPILQAMERSIETARRRRMHDGQAPAEPRPVPVEPHRPVDDAEAPRRKARPKRSTPMLRPHYDGAEYRAEAV